MMPVCVPCRRFFRAAKNGFCFIEGMPITNLAPPGLEAPELWKPYKIWVSDRLECLGCGASILIGFGREPISEHYMPDFEEWITRLKANQLQVNDCC